MNNYSIVRIGSDYVVQADEKSILKVASRRRAARLVSRAAELLETPPAPRSEHGGPSIARDPGISPDPGAKPDPKGIAGSREVP
jgi:hypothetical protein